MSSMISSTAQSRLLSGYRERETRQASQGRSTHSSVLLMVVELWIWVLKSQMAREPEVDIRAALELI